MKNKSPVTPKNPSTLVTLGTKISQVTRANVFFWADKLGTTPSKIMKEAINQYLEKLESESNV